MGYLVTKKKAGSDLYPADPKGRALVDQRLYYDATNVFTKLGAIVRPGLYLGVKTVDPNHKAGIREVLKVLDIFLQGEDYFAGKKLTIADFSIATTITSFDEMGYNLSEYENLNRWFDQMQMLPHFDENQAGAKALANAMRSAYPGETLY